MTSTEVTTQGGPLTKAMYGIGIIPLIELLQKPNVTQKWYAEDGSAANDLNSLRAILKNLDEHGKAFGYNVKPSKSRLILKENCRESAIKVFNGANITKVDNFRVLGLVLGLPSACNKYIENKIEKTATPTETFSKKKPEHLHKMGTPATQTELKIN